MPPQTSLFRINPTHSVLLPHDTIDATSGVVSRLPAKLQAKLESIFSADFSDVRVHRGPQAASIQAAAFALGSDLYFAPGACDFESESGLELLGHELAHVMQQRCMPVAKPRTGLQVVHDPELEEQAHRVGRFVASECLRSTRITPNAGSPWWGKSGEHHRHSAGQTLNGGAGIIQRRFFIGSNGFSNHDGNLGELATKIVPYAATIDIGEITQTLWRFDFQNRRFKNLADFLCALNQEILLDRYESATPVPKYLHHFWSGGALSEGAFINILAWRDRAERGGWWQYILTDGVVNQAFADAKLKRQLEIFSASGIVVVDISQLPFASKAVYEHLRTSMLHTMTKSKLPYLSDLARYAQLLALGGLYVDVDVNPGTVNMSEMLTSVKGIPQMGPCFRTNADAKLHGYFNPLETARTLAVVTMFSKQKNNIGNHFIAAPARNAVVAKANEIATAQVKECEITNGGADFLKALCRMDGLGESAVQASLPSWAMQVQWVTPESDKTVD